MTAVVGMLLKSWGIPRMNMRCVRSSWFEGNTGSWGVLEKNGFVLRKTVQDCVYVVAKGESPEGPRTVHFTELIPSPY
jgi:RimJ/RimL family protein N-acetyltransferase